MAIASNWLGKQPEPSVLMGTDVLPLQPLDEVGYSLLVPEDGPPAGLAPARLQ